MALVQRKFTDLPGASALGASDIIPIVTSPTNVNKKIAGQVLIDSLATSALLPLTSYLIANDLIVDASILNPDNFIRPSQNDAVERIRMAEPQSLIDTDFEYSLQSSKWENLQMTNNSPSLFVRSNEPSLTPSQITGIFNSETIAVAVASAINTETFPDPRETRNGPLTAGWSAVYEGTLTNIYDYYGNFVETIDALIDGGYGPAVTVNVPFPYYYFGTTYNSVALKPGWNGIPVSLFDWSGSGSFGMQTGLTITRYIGISLSLQGVSATNSGNNAPAGSSYGNVIKRVYTKHENVGTVNERFIMLVYGFLDNPMYNYNVTPLPSRYNNRGYEDMKYVGIFYKQTPNRLSYISLSGRDPGGSRHVVANYRYGEYGFSEYPTASYIVYGGHNRVYDFFTLSNNNNIRINTNYTPTPLLSAGAPIVLRETLDPNIDGSGIIQRVISQGSPNTNTGASFVVNLPRVPDSTRLLAPSGYKTQYSTFYTGGFLQNSEYPVVALSGLGGTTIMLIQTASPQRVLPGQAIYLLDALAIGTDTYTGNFTVFNVLSSNIFTVQNNNLLSAYGADINLLKNTNTLKLYTRPTGIALHRNVDGGVQINNSNLTPTSKIIRQTRKYFRYQSGKSILFSTGLLFKPSYDIATISTSTGSYAVPNNPFYTITITTDQDHGFAANSSYTQGSRIRLAGVVTSLEPNTYNREYTVQSVLSPKTFTVLLPVSSIGSGPVDLQPGGIPKVDVIDWYDATVRSGMFDEQNGIFFQCNGHTFAIGKRDSVLNLTGTVNCTFNSTFITGNNTKFLSQLVSGEYIAIKGMSYQINEVLSDTLLTIMPSYRGSTSTLNKCVKTVDTIITQQDFNLDKLDGTGPSGYVIDLNRMQMIYFDYSWYGAGRIRWGVRSTNGDIVYCHEMINNNVNTEAYMRSGNLPARFEIVNEPQRTNILQTNRMQLQCSPITSPVGYTDVTLKRSTNLIDYSTLSPVVSARVTNGTTQTFTVTSSNLDTFFDYKIFDPNNIDLSTTITSLSDATLFRISTINMPNSGKLNIGNEYLNYSTLSSFASPVNHKLISVSRNTNGLLNVPPILINGNNVQSFNMNCSPALSHWGTSVIMDGNFNVDKSYLFTAINTSSFGSITNTTDIPLISIRLAPSVDSGITGVLGSRNLVNRSTVSLKSVGIITNQTLNVTLKLNSISTLFETLTNWQPLGIGSLSQYIDHSTIGISPAPVGGDVVLSFFANEQSTGRNEVTTVSIDSIRELSNSILGGNNIYPDGPDVLTVFARANSNTATTVRARISWTEAQG
jgi:hypothetical protein